jgi:hypothetical protein
MRGYCVIIIRAVYDRLMVSNILNKENVKEFPLHSGMRQSCSVSLLLVNIVIKILARVSKRDTNRKGRSQIIPILT